MNRKTKEEIENTTIEWLAKIHREILKTQELIIDIEKNRLKMELKKVRIKQL